MIRTEILSSIDRINEAADTSNMIVVGCILEYYCKASKMLECCDDTSIIDNMVIFQEGETSNTEIETKKGIGTKILDAIRHIVEAIKNAFSSLINKITGNVEEGAVQVREAVSACRQKISRKRSEGLFSKMKKFREEHPIILTIGTLAAGTGIAYGGSKAIDAVGKRKAMKDLSDEDKDFIKKHFDPDTNSVTIPYEIRNIYAAVNTGFEMYNNLYNRLVNDLGMVGDEEPSAAKCDEYFKTPEKFDRVISELNKIETYMSQRNVLSGFNGSTTIPNGIDGWNEMMGNYKSSTSDAEQCYARIVSLDTLLFDAITKISDENRRNKCSDQLLKVSNLMNRHQTAMNDVITIELRLSEIAAVLDSFLPKYYAIEKKIKEVKTEIGECLDAVARLISIATNKPSENEWNRYIELKGRNIKLQRECSELEREVRDLNISKGNIERSIASMNASKSKLLSDINKLSSKLGDTDTSEKS